MADIITTLHPEGAPEDDLYPNIKRENLPSDLETLTAFVETEYNKSQGADGAIVHASEIANVIRDKNSNIKTYFGAFDVVTYWPNGKYLLIAECSGAVGESYLADFAHIKVIGGAWGNGNIIDVYAFGRTGTYKKSVIGDSSSGYIQIYLMKSADNKLQLWIAGNDYVQFSVVEVQFRQWRLVDSTATDTYGDSTIVATIY